MTTSTTEPPPAHPRPVAKLRWWREALYILGFYAAYSLVRDLHGTAPVSKFHAFGNAEKIIDVEQYLGMYQERRVQSWFLHAHLLVRLFDDYYGAAHFVITFAVLLWLFRRQPGRYPRWRNTLALTSSVALLGFAFFPLMPPRLLPPSYHFVDTLRVIGGFWSFNSGAVNAVSNQYAAMPSLHFAWSLWCALAVRPAIKGRVTRELVWLYPALTVLCVVVTGNHYFADVVAGGVTLAAGYGLARLAATVVAGRTGASA